MGFERSRGVVPLLLERESSESTNSELLALSATEELSPYTTLVTRDQTAGRGRLDRTWTAPAGRALAISVLVPFPAEQPGWVPLVAGLAMADAVGAAIGDNRVRLKWPNDVLLDDRKVCGVLAELGAAGIVVGAGLNTAMSATELPVPTATSLAVAGADVDLDLEDALLAAYLSGLRDAVDALLAGDVGPLRDRVRAACSTIGRDVRVQLPGGGDLVGRAASIDEAGHLVIENGAGRHSVAAGDVVHVRPARG